MASSDAPDSLRLQAHYECDGIDDQTEINLAIAAAANSDSADTVVLTSGKFHVAVSADSSCIVMMSNVSLIGSGESSEIALIDGVFLGRYVEGQIISIPPQNSNIRISNLSINGNYANNEVGIGIEITNSDSITVDSVTIYNTAHHLIGVYGSRNVSILNNIGYDCGPSHGIDVDRFGEHISEQVLIQGNHVWNQGHNPCKVENCADVILENNIFEANEVNNFNFAVSNNDGDNALVCENIFLNNNTFVGGEVAVHERTGSVSLVNNQFVDAYLSLAFGTGSIEILDNDFSIETFQEYAVTCGVLNPPIGNVVISENSILGNGLCDNGMWLRGEEVNYIVQDNHISGCTKSGIALRSGENNSIVSSNHLVSRETNESVDYGISCWVDSAEVYGNILDGQHTGIRIIDGQSTLVEANTIFRNPEGNGIIEVGTADFTHLRNNTIADKDPESSINLIGANSTEEGTRLSAEKPSITAIALASETADDLININWQASIYDGFVDATISRYDVWRLQASNRILLDSVHPTASELYQLTVDNPCDTLFCEEYMEIEAITNVPGVVYTSALREIICDSLALGNEVELVIPTSTELQQNYPNPFNSFTAIRYQLASPSRIGITIYNMLGERIKTLIDEQHDAGSFCTFWDGTDNSGMGVSSGTYFYVLNDGHSQVTRKISLIR